MALTAAYRQMRIREASKIFAANDLGMISGRVKL
jgi:hypothetical protein